jgi:hypothetical protein
MGVGNNQLDPPQPAPRQAFQKRGPEGFGLRGTNMEPDDLAPAISIGRDSDYRGDRGDATALALLQIGGIEPQIRPLADQRAVEIGMGALVDLARLRVAEAGAGS